MVVTVHGRDAWIEKHERVLGQIAGPVRLAVGSSPIEGCGIQHCRLPNLSRELVAHLKAVRLELDGPPLRRVHFDRVPPSSPSTCVGGGRGRAGKAHDDDGRALQSGDVVAHVLPGNLLDERGAPRHVDRFGRPPRPSCKVVVH